MVRNERGEVLRQAVEACVVGKVDALPELFTPDVSGWSPNMLVGSLDELREVVAEREDAFSDVAMQVDALDVFGKKGFMEYRLTGVFSRPFFIDENTVVEPNGRELLVGAALVAEFTGDKISAFRNYFDDSVLMEQMLAVQR